MSAKRVALGVWLLILAACILVVMRTPIRTDMGTFLPRSSSMAQQALTDQASHGAPSHLMLLLLEGAKPSVLAQLSERVAERLRDVPAFVEVLNGDENGFVSTRDFVWRNRYLLSENSAPDRFTVAGLQAALIDDLTLLGSPLGPVIQESLPSDPTGAMLALLSRFQRQQGPGTRDGVWFSPDGSGALLLVHTRAAGFEIDAQKRNLELVNAAFTQARTDLTGVQGARLRITGPGVFAVHIQQRTKYDATRLSLLATAVAASLLAFAYRSPTVLVLGLLPVASGVLAAIATVSLAFGFVHGITLGFGVTLIGESVDYAIYLFTQATLGESVQRALSRIWPTLRLGALTSIVGFCAMLFSSFTGFAQLGLFSIVGLIAAACVTRFVLPHLTPRDFYAVGADRLAVPMLAVIRHRARISALVALVMLAAAAALAAHHAAFWDENLADLSPVPAADQTLYDVLQQDLGVPASGYAAVFRASGEQPALEESEKLEAMLSPLVAAQQLGSFEVPSAILPSAQSQRARQTALPDAQSLRARFDEASAGLPFRTETFEPFFHDIAAAKTAPLLTRSTLPPALALRVDSTLIDSPDGWTVVAPLTRVADPTSVAAALATARLPGLTFVDLSHESDSLLHTFQYEAVMLASIGGLAILALLSAVLRATRRVVAVVAPLVSSVVVTAALLTLGDGTLTIFMVVGFLLIVAVGSNYCLFFECSTQDAAVLHRSVASVVLANLCTVSAYGLMSLSSIPVLHDIGMTVAVGAFLSMCFAAALSTRGAMRRAPVGYPECSGPSLRGR
jgi:predicted exporter